MEDEGKSRRQLLRELALLRRKVAELATSEAARKQAEETLAAERNLLRTLMDGLPDPVFVKDTDGRYLATNPAHARVAGLASPEQVVGKRDLDLFHDESVRRYFYADDQHVLTSGEPLISREQMVIDADGQERWFLTSKVPLRDAGGSVVGLVGVSRDITQRKRAEEALEEYSERLVEIVEERTRELREAQEELLRKEKLALLGEVAGAMSHELRNPLGAIKNAVYYLNMVLEAPDPEVRDTLDILNLEVGNCAKIVQDLLDFARSRPPVHVQIEVNDTVRGALSDIPVPEGVEVVAELDEGLPPILADALQLKQVFRNIITNAFQAMPQGGRLLVRSRAAEGEGVAISFTDTGVGISEENLGKMFEPLFTTKARGIGLGLAAVRLLLERHGGKVEVESELGRGSTFTVWLPVGGALDRPSPGPRA